MRDRYTIFRLEPQDTSTERLRALGASLFDLGQDFRLDKTDDALVLRHGHRSVELSQASGGVWAADASQLWRPSVKAELPSADDAVRQALALADRHGLLPKLDAPLAWAKPVVGGTFHAQRDIKTGKRQQRQLDVQVVFGLQVDGLPVVGGGGDFTFTLGHKAQLIGFSGNQRLAKPAFEAQAIAPEQALEQWRASAPGLVLEDIELMPAYYAAPSHLKQDFLYPVYVVKGMIVAGKQRLPMRQALLPASDFGPPLAMPTAQDKRAKRARAAHRATELSKGDQRPPRRGAAPRAPTRPWEAGTSWIGQLGGLGGSQANAQGFVDEWAAAGWHINFNWGDANAFESDWRRNDDTWVDAADFVFYTGHADMNGWMLANPDDGTLSYTEVGNAPGTPGDLWGANDLEWVTIAACGPLQDSILYPGGGDVLARWDGAFDGLHLLMGYGGVTFDNTEEGGRLARYAKGGATLIDAWFRTAKEIQPATNGYGAPDGPNIYVGAMWVGKAGADPVSDHAWDYGSVSADPTSPSFLACMWTLT